MQKPFVVLICLMFSSILSFGQFFSWIENGGGSESDAATQVTTDGAGNVYAVGNIQGAGIAASFYSDSVTTVDSGDIFLTKTDRYGNPRFFKKFGSSKVENLNAVAAENNMVVIGGDIQSQIQFGAVSSTNLGASFFVTSLDTSGSVNWVFNTDSVFSMNTPSITGVEISNGNVYACGYFYDVIYIGNQAFTGPAGIKTPFILKLNSSGVFQWFHQLTVTGSSQFNSLKVGSNGSIYAAGFFRGSLSDGAITVNSSGNADMFVMKLNSLASPIWVQKIGNTGNEGINSIDVNQNNIVLGGYFNGQVNFLGTNKFSKGSEDGFYALMDTVGIMKWVEAFGGAKAEQCLSVSISDSNKIAVGSYLNDIPSIKGKNFTTKKLLGFILLVDTNNNLLKLRTLNENTHQAITGVSFYKDDELAVCGYMIGTTDFAPYGELKTKGKKDFIVGKLKFCGALIPAPIALNGDSTICDGDSTILFTTNVANKSHSWLKNNVLISDQQKPFLAVFDSGVYQVIVNFDGCEDTSTSIKINVNLSPVVSIDPFTNQCVGMDSVTLTQGVPTGGIFSGIGVANNKFDPNIGKGVYSLDYSMTNSFGCTDTATRNMLVDSVPLVSYSGIVNLCSHDTFLTLSGGLPVGGVYSGIAVINGIFDARVGFGTFEVYYTLTTNLGCSSIDTNYVQVDTLPKIDIKPLNNICLFNGQISLDHAAPSGGTYIGGGVTNNVFDPLQTGVDTFWLTYEFTALNGCSNSRTSTITVADAPKPQLVDSVELCYKTPLKLSLQNSYTQYLWEDGSTGLSLDFDAQNLKVGGQFIGVTVYDDFGCPGFDSTYVLVDYCQTVEVTPNPNFGAFNISINSFENDYANLKLVSSQGKIILHKELDILPGENTYYIDLFSLYSGIYTLVIEFDDRYLHRQVMILNQY